MMMSESEFEVSEYLVYKGESDNDHGMDTSDVIERSIWIHTE